MRLFIRCIFFIIILGNAHAQILPAAPVANEVLKDLPVGAAFLPLTSFYEFDQNSLRYLNKHPGDIIKIEAISAPTGAKAWRVMYVSRTEDDRLVPVTGIVVAPATTPNNGSRPVITWAHGTTGGARGCAPSLVTQPAQNLVQHQPLSKTPIDIGIPYLTDFLKQGYVVVATDYYGLGGPGVHQYLNGNTAARNSIDIVRAAKHMPETHAGSHFVGFGWSQGGQAALFIAESQLSYAPELRLDGIATVAPASSISNMVPVMLTVVPNSPFNFLTIRGMTDSYNIVPSFLTERGKNMVELSGQVCLSMLAQRAGVDPKPVVTMNPFKIQPWKAAFELNDSGRRPTSTPILIVQGSNDHVVFETASKAYQHRACATNKFIQLTIYSGQDHRSMFDPAKAEILKWIHDRTNHEPAPSNCPKSSL